MTVALAIWFIGVALTWPGFTYTGHPYQGAADILTVTAIAFCAATIWPVLALVGLYDLTRWARHRHHTDRHYGLTDKRPSPKAQQHQDALLAALATGDELSTHQLVKASGMLPGSAYVPLRELERTGHVQSRWEADDPLPDRPRRRLYRLTTGKHELPEPPHQPVVSVHDLPAAQPWRPR